MRARSEMIAMFKRAGFTLARLNGHATWNCPCGHRRITSATTPGKGRGMTNIRLEIKRTLRTCNQRRSTA